MMHGSIMRPCASPLLPPFTTVSCFMMKQSPLIGGSGCVLPTVPHAHGLPSPSLLFQGAQGIALTIAQSGWLPWHLTLTQSMLLLCQRFRYRVTLTAWVASGTAHVILQVNGGSAHGYQAVSEGLNATLTTQMQTFTHDFEVLLSQPLAVPLLRVYMPHRSLIQN